MKRLLAYLFVVLGFGLTFNVSANAKIVFCEVRFITYEGEIIPAGQGGNYRKKYDVEPVYFTKNKCYFAQDSYSGKRADHPQISLENYIDQILRYRMRIGQSSYGSSDFDARLNVGRSIIKEFEKNKFDTTYLISALEDKYRIPKKYLEISKKTQIAKAKPSKTQEVVDTVSIKLSKSEVDAIFTSVNLCWKIPLGLPADLDASVKIKVRFSPDGYIYSAEQINRAKNNKHSYYSVLAESALRAIKLCQPINAPKAKYKLWQEVVFVFDARAALNSIESEETKIAKNNLLKKYTETKIAKAEPTITPKKKVNVAKVEEPKQEEFKPENKDIDNDAPVIEIAEAITVDSQAYTLKGKVKDKSQIYLTIDGRQVDVKKGKFELDRFNIDPDVAEEIKIVAIDKWNNRTEKIIKVTIDLQSTDIAKVYEELNPNNVKVKTDKNKIAIIIGIEKYENLTNLDAKYANRDAKAFRAYATRALGIKPSNIKMLIDDKAKRGNTLEAFKIWLPKISGKGGKDIHIFFAGHGLASENGKDLYVLPQDGNAKLLDDTAITRLELISLIQKVNPKSVTMFFDTCYSGQTRDEKMLVASLLRPIQIITEEQDTPDNFTIFSASNYDQVSGGIEEAQHGMFSYYLMKGLEGKADENKDKKITNGELIAYLKENVSQEALTQNREQDPMLAGDPEKVLMSYR